MGGHRWHFLTRSALSQGCEVVCTTKVDKSSNLSKGKYTSLVTVESGETTSSESAADPIPVSVDGPLSTDDTIKTTNQRTNKGK